MLSTLFENQIYLGFPTDQPLQQPTHEITFMGGIPIFLREPEKGQLLCENCLNQSLTFICQVFCPLQADQCYNRVLYIFFCEKCQHQFRCLKQQCSKTDPVEHPKVVVPSVKQYSLEIESQTAQIKELQKIRNKAKHEIQEEIIEEEQFEEEGQEFEIKEIQIDLSHLGLAKEQQMARELGEEKLEGLKVASESMEQTKKEEKDLVFEEYCRVMNQLDGPVLLYSNIPLPYNSQPVNPRHFCKHCKAKLTLELQITEKMLLLSPKLINLDWGSLMVFTCSNSCSFSIEECVVVQFQADAVKDSQVKALKKRQKNRNRKEKSNKKIQDNLSKEKQEDSQSPEQKAENEEGDWD